MPSRFFNRILVLVLERHSEVSFRVFLRSFFFSKYLRVTPLSRGNGTIITTGVAGRIGDMSVS